MTTSSETEAGPAVKERHIYFTGEEVRAILAGKKSMTRRVVKPQPESQGVAGLTPGGEFWYIWPDDDGIEHFAKCPYGKPGSRLWVRETFWLQTDLGLPSNEPQPIHYTADGNTQCLEDYTQKPSIFMPRWASRITLEVTGVRVERLQSISEADCIAEGIEDIGAGDLRGMFASLWSGINAKRGYPWSASPWVWVIEFKVVQP